MATLLDEVTASLTELGVLAEGEVPSAKMGADALASLNRMIDQWAAEGMLFYVYLRTVWTIAASTQDYTVGLAGTIITSRPISGELIGQVNYYDSSQSPNTEIPLSFLNDQQWQSLPQKTATGAAPYAWHYNPTYPLGVLSVYPVPTASGLRGVMYAPSQIAQFAYLSDSVAMPPGYSELLVTNLAVKLAASYKVQLDPDLKQRAREAKAIVKRSNTRLVDLTFPADALIGTAAGNYNIYTDR